LNDIKIWIFENIYSPTELPFPSEVDWIIDFTSLNQCQQVGKRAKEENTSSLVIYLHLLKVAQVLTHKCHLPPIEELGKTISMEQLLEKI
jgi:hypothetical protein